MSKKDDIVKHLNEKMPFCDEGNCIYNWELNCITDNPEVITNRVTQGNADGQWCAMCPCFKEGEHVFYNVT